MKETFYKGAAGNLSLHLVTISLAALATEATKVVTESLPIGTQITGVRIVNEALGTGTKLTAQVVSHEGDTTDLVEFDTESAGNGGAFIKPAYIGDEGPSDLVVKNTGSSSATGEVVLQLEYRYTGY
ncbi:hypothetical protein PSH54_19205 [Pseudoalteromonas sp. Angola-30]|uniref:hypothetical protein n=1 Tax=Pseudoalteromonas sp. Angola-30 TaxID=3025341 RepID=UPI0023580DFA|nr:hypothetical protein [Pseudoalteromonas sp. Angola-30]MDC9527609.1 hypothetical protein [Pseudoalteromonas sp. Angola-30]